MSVFDADDFVLHDMSFEQRICLHERSVPLPSLTIPTTNPCPSSPGKLSFNFMLRVTTETRLWMSVCLSKSESDSCVKSATVSRAACCLASAAVLCLANSNRNVR